MKKNISSKAIKSMAIGLSIALGSTAVLGGVIPNTLAVVQASSQVKSAIVDITTNVSAPTITIEFNDSVTDSATPVTLTEFTTNAGTVSTTVLTSGAVGTNKLVITLNAAITITDPITVTYTATTSSAAVKVGGVDLDLTGLSIDVTSPTLGAITSPVVTGATTIEIPVVDTLDTTTATISNDGGFTITDLASNTVTVSQVDIANNMLTLTVPTLTAETYTVTYIAPTPVVIKNTNGIGMATDNTGVTFTVAPLVVTVPDLTSSVYDSKANTVTVTVSESLKVLASTNTGHGLTIKDSKGKDVDITSVEVKTGALTDIVVTLDASTVTTLPNETYTVTYTTPTTPILESETNTGTFLKDGATSEFVVKPTENTQVTSAEIDLETDDKTIVITTNGALVDATTNPAIATEFAVVDGDGTTNLPLATNGLKLDTTAKTITLTLASPYVGTSKYLGVTYTTSNTDKIQVTPTSGSATDLDTTTPISVTVKEKVAPPVNDKEVTVNGFTFLKDATKTATLTAYSKPISRFARLTTTPVETTFVNGILTDKTGTYTLTTIGNGTDALTTVTDEVLKDHTAGVTTVSASAFKGNTTVTTLKFPKVTNVGNDAFSGATALTTVDLGSKVTTKITLGTGVFTGATKIEKVTTNEASKTIVETEAKKGNDKVVVEFPKDTTTPDGEGNNGGNNNGGSGQGSSNGTGAVLDNDGNIIGTDENTVTHTGDNTVTVPTKDLTLDVITLPTITGESKVFGDVASTFWAQEHIDKLSKAGIINGIDGNFVPNGHTKRADVTIMISKLLGLDNESTMSFNDVDVNAYYAPYVAAAKEYGIVNGSNGNFNPESTISRQDTMVMLGQILKGLTDVNTDTSTLNSFNDISSISGYATEYVAILVNSDIISGSNGQINPLAPVTRAEMATMMSKLYDMLVTIK